MPPLRQRKVLRALRELRAARDNYTAVDLAVVEAQKVKAAAAATMALIVGSSAKPQRSKRGGGGLAGSVTASKAAADSESESERASITVIGTLTANSESV